MNKKEIFALCAGLMVASSGAAFAQEDGAQPGPGQAARQKLFERIQQAKSQGIGIGGYLQAFKALEEQAKGGDGEEKINSRVEAIHKSINDQMERAKVLKTQRPLPPQGSQVKGSDPIPTAGGPPAGGLPAGIPGGLADKIKGKFGDKLDGLPDGLKDRLQDPETRQKLMERFGNRLPGGEGALGGLGGGGDKPGGQGGPGGGAQGGPGGGGQGGPGGGGQGGPGGGGQGQTAGSD